MRTNRFVGLVVLRKKRRKIFRRTHSTLDRIFFGIDRLDALDIVVATAKKLAKIFPRRLPVSRVIACVIARRSVVVARIKKIRIRFLFGIARRLRFLVKPPLRLVIVARIEKIVVTTRPRLATLIFIAQSQRLLLDDLRRHRRVLLFFGNSSRYLLSHCFLRKSLFFLKNRRSPRFALLFRIAERFIGFISADVVGVDSRLLQNSPRFLVEPRHLDPTLGNLGQTAHKVSIRRYRPCFGQHNRFAAQHDERQNRQNRRVEILRHRHLRRRQIRLATTTPLIRLKRLCLGCQYITYHFDVARTQTRQRRYQRIVSLDLRQQRRRRHAAQRITRLRIRINPKRRLIVKAAPNRRYYARINHRRQTRQLRKIRAKSPPKIRRHQIRLAHQVLGRRATKNHHQRQTIRRRKLQRQHRHSADNAELHRHDPPRHKHFGRLELQMHRMALMQTTRRHKRIVDDLVNVIARRKPQLHPPLIPI